MDDRKAVSCRLAGSGLRAGHQVTAADGDGYGVALNWGWLSVVAALDVLVDGLT